MGGAPSTLSGRQDAGQNSFSDSKFSASADSTSSPVPSTVGNTVGQQPAFNLGKFRLLGHMFIGYLIFFNSQLPHSPLRLPSTPRCRLVTPTSTVEWAACPASSTEGAWRGAESTLVSTPASRCPQLPAPHQPASSRTRRPTETGNGGWIVQEWIIDYLCSFSLQLRNKLRQSRPESWPEQLWIREEQLRQ